MYLILLADGLTSENVDLFHLSSFYALFDMSTKTASKITSEFISQHEITSKYFIV